MNACLLALSAWLAGQSPPADAGAADGAVPAGEMAALLQQTLQKLAQKNTEDGLANFRAGNLPAALEQLRQARELDPESPDVLLHLGNVHQALGNTDAAEQSWRAALVLAPDHQAARLALADLLAARHDPRGFAEAQALLQRVRELRGNDPDVVLRQARVAARAGRVDDAERFYDDVIRLGRTPPETRMEVADFLQGMGRDRDARALYEQLRNESAWSRRAAERLRQVAVEEQARRLGWSRPSGEVPAPAQALLARARSAAAQQRRAEAEEALRECLRMAPQFTDARLDLAGLHQAAGRMGDAELELLRALAFDQRNAEVHARLGLMLLDAESPRAPEAALYLSRALLLRPERSEWNLALARALRLGGDFRGALARVDAFLQGDGTEEARREALSLKLALQRLLPTDSPDPTDVPRATGTDTALVDRLGRARAYLSRGETDAALAELREVGGTDRDAEVRGLEGRILMAAGRQSEAAAAFRASLAVHAAQPDIHEQLGLVLSRLGEEAAARAELERAEATGAPEATYHLARLALERAQRKPLAWTVRLHAAWRARARLDHFLTAAPPGALRSDAWAMRDSVDRLLATLLLPGAAALALLLALLAVAMERRFGGTDLRGLLTRHPEVGPAVQRILAAIRHEVLKHNTLVLSGVVDALERGDDVSAHAAHLRSTLLEGGSGPAVLDRLHGYELELASLGRAHGVRLNLHHRDRALSALHRGFTLLRRVEARLSRAASLGRLRRRLLLGDVRRATALLNADAYEAVRALLDELRVLRVDEAFLRSVYARVSREPAFRPAQLRPLALDARVPLPVGVGIPRAALEDALFNLLRNALQASLREGLSPVEVGLGVDLQVDAVTGLERVVFSVRDRARARLDPDTLARQRITGGLGLVRDVAGRYEGSVDVTGPHDGWQKAVVLKLPREELPGAAPAHGPPLLEAG
ncbi:MAG: tetratricopeptide repeat protein [Deltaproteobacteria bacterium]|nr:tetratricopeptide repeat protein [Deltaproteobacteria bacterium]